LIFALSVSVGAWLSAPRGNNKEDVAKGAVAIYLVNHFKLARRTSTEDVDLYLDTFEGRYQYTGRRVKFQSGVSPTSGTPLPWMWSQDEYDKAMTLMETLKPAPRPTDDLASSMAAAGKKVLEAYERVEPFLEEPKYNALIMGLKFGASVANQEELDPHAVGRAVHDLGMWSLAGAIVRQCIAVRDAERTIFFARSLSKDDLRSEKELSGEKLLQGRISRTLIACKHLMPSRGDMAYLDGI
jgi:hypothetical protein